MYRVEPRHKFSADITRVDYIQPLDYIRPAVGGFVVGMLYMSIVSVVCSVLDPARAAIMLSVGTMGAIMSAWIYAVTAVAAAATVHCMWYHRLTKFGPHAFERRMSLQISQKQAFELCLAASAQVKNQKIVGMDDHLGEIRVQTPPSSILHEHTNIDIRMTETIDGVTHVSMTAEKAITRLRMGLLRAMWGDKWVPLILAVGNREQHEKAMDEIADHIRTMPNWNYAHRSITQDEKAS
jgi:hypothetical protein